MRRDIRMKVLTLVVAPALLAGGSLTLLARGTDASAATCQGASGVVGEYAALVGSNGLYVLPQLLSMGEASLYDTAYADLAAQAAGGAVATTASVSRVRALLKGEVSGSAVWRSWYLLAIQRTTGQPVLDETDAAAVARVLAPGGYADERPPGAPAASPGARLSDTAAAVDVLVAVRGPAAVAALGATRTWLEQQVALPQAHPYLDWLTVRTLLELGDRIPQGALDRASAWSGRQVHEASAQDYGAEAHDLYGFVSLLRAAGRPVPEAIYRFFEPLRQQLTEQHDAQLVYYVTAAWAGRPDAPSRSVLAAIAARRGAEGLVAPDAKLVGGVDASYAVQSIRTETGENSCDPGLAEALSRFDGAQWSHFDAPTKAMWVASMKMARGDVDEARRRAALRAALADLPSVVAPDNVRRWALEAELVQELGGTVPLPGGVHWPVTDRLGLSTAATVVTTYARLHADLGQVGAVRSADFGTALDSLELTPTTAEYFDALSAYVVLGGRLGPDLVHRAVARAHAVTGCPASGRLAREAPSGRDCDLRSSLSLARARQLLPELR